MIPSPPLRKLFSSQVRIVARLSSDSVKANATSLASRRESSVTTASAVDQGLSVVPEVPKRNGETSKLDNLRGFVDYERTIDPYRAPELRIHDWGEINTDPDAQDPVARKKQAARCMDCGTPFCHTHTGCPINNLIPEWNTLVYKGKWKEAYYKLNKTNNFPEFTGRVCPAPCEGACVAGLIDEAVTIKNIEYAIVDKAFKEGWIKATPPSVNTQMRVNIVGSGPAGLACADQLNKMGHSVTVYEREDRVGGLLTYGIPNMKLEKRTVERRVQLLQDEGVKFVTNAEIGGPDPKYSLHSLRSLSDAVVLCGGATKPRDLRIPGRNFAGVHFAMDYLTAAQKKLFQVVDSLDGGDENVSTVTVMDWDANLQSDTFKRINVKGKDVVVIGGGDTGTDCIATSVRMQCKSMTNLELQTMPPQSRAETNPWPEWPRTFKVDYGHAEVETHYGADPRLFGVVTKEFVGEEGVLKGIKIVDTIVEGGVRKEVAGSERIIPADIAILALGFVAPEAQLYEGLGLDVDAQNNIKATYGDYRTLDRSNGRQMEDVFAAGDCRRGQSLVVWAIHEGREVADKVNAYLLR